MKRVSVAVTFKEDMKPLEVEAEIKRALRQKRVVVTKFRNTYVESKFGMAEMPASIFLALQIADSGGFGWYFPKLSGVYKFDFEE